ncbi:hypothetical protein NPIL_411261 [Nephila pilipes]|uniref:Uncharacterized protein n=1 Tax=Nephila pilipes TaxID=299642 RepID=A0A8X6IMH6_NEPPI|nr:hypothetical protein NPIL_411261 [Nephila pilipes]
MYHASSRNEFITTFKSIEDRARARKMCRRAPTEMRERPEDTFSPELQEGEENPKIERYPDDGHCPSSGEPRLGKPRITLGPSRTRSFAEINFPVILQHCCKEIAMNWNFRE